MKGMFAMLLALAMIAGEFGGTGLTEAFAAEIIKEEPDTEVTAAPVETDESTIGDAADLTVGVEANDDVLTDGELTGVEADGEANPEIEDAVQESGEESALIETEDPDEELSGSIEAEGDGEVVEYDLWVGEYRVTSANKDAIPGIIGDEGAKATFDPDTFTLTFEGNVTGVTETYGDGWQVYCSASDTLTITGIADLLNAEARHGIYSQSGLNMNGNINVAGKVSAIIAGGDIHLKGVINAEVTSSDSTLLAIRSLRGKVICNAEINAKGRIIGETGIEFRTGSVTATLPSGSGFSVIEVDDDGSVVIGDDLEITTPLNGKISSDNKKIITDDDQSVKEVIIEPKERYDLWVGGVRVTGENKDDIPSVIGKDAKASYDPENKILTFEDVEGIRGYKAFEFVSGYTYLAKVYSIDGLTIKGSAVIEGEGNNSFGIFEETSVDDIAMTLDGDITIHDCDYAIYVPDGYETEFCVTGKLTIDSSGFMRDGIYCGNLKVDGGTVNVTKARKAISCDAFELSSGSVSATNYAMDNSSYALLVAGDAIITGGSLKAEAETAYEAIRVLEDLSISGGSLEAIVPENCKAMLVDKNIILEAPMTIAEPENGKVCKSEYGAVIMDADENPAAHVLIKADTVHYVGVTFISNGEEVGKKYAAKGSTLSEFIADPEPAASGDQFLGWFHDEKCTDRADLNDVYTKDSTLYAKWASAGTETYTVTFESVYAGDIPDQIIEKGGKVSQPVIPTVVGNHIFRYWYIESNNQPYDFDAPVTKNLTLNALWGTPSYEFSVEFDNAEVEGKNFYNATAERWELTYNGSKRTLTENEESPLIYVYSASGLMKRGVDYTLIYKNNKNVSTNKKYATVTVKGKGRYKGSKTFKYYIVPRPVPVNESGQLDDESTDFRMDPIWAAIGKKFPAPAIYYKGKKLTSKDYKVNYTGKVKDSTAEVTIAFKGNFQGTIKAYVLTFGKKKEIDQNTIRVSFKPGTHTFTPSDNDETQYCIPHTVTVTKPGEKGELTVKNSKGEILREFDGLDGDFKLIYFNNLYAGTAKVMVYGVNAYHGSVTKTFKIKPNTSIPLTLTGKPDTDTDIYYVPGGTKPADSIKVSITDPEGPYKDVDGTELVVGRDYKITWSNNKAISTGRKKAGYKITFTGNYKGHAPISGSFNIVKADFKTNSSAQYMIRVNAPDLVYTGKKKYESKPIVMLTDSSKGINTLLSSKDYSVRYFTTVDGTEQDITGRKITLGADEDVKLIRMELTGKGNFKNDTVSKYYYVRKKAGVIDLSKAKIAAKGNKKRKPVGTKTYTGAPITPEIDVYVKSGRKWALVNPSAYTVTYINNENVGKGTILITGRGSSAVGSKSAKFTISKRNLKGFLFGIIE